MAWDRPEEKQKNENLRANLCQADLTGFGSDGGPLEMTNADLRQANLDGADLFRARLEGENFAGASMRCSKLQFAVLHDIDFSRTLLWYADFQNAHIEELGSGVSNRNGAIFAITPQRNDFTGAAFVQADLRHTKFEDSNLTDSDFLLADLREAYIGGSSAELQGAKFTRARLEGLTFGSSGSLPNIGSFAEAQGLNALAYEGDSPSTLSWIREELKRRGFTEQENEITYAIWRTRTARGGRLEKIFNGLLFDSTCRYGMSPGHAIRILWYSFWSFTIIYVFAQRWPSARGGIWADWPADRVRKDEGANEPERLHDGFPISDASRTLAGRIWRTLGLSSVFLATYFSLLSAVRIGWQEFNFAVWFSRMQPREYRLKATGWVRFVSGLQSLLSVYLVALWVLAYFGTPFE